MADCNIQLNIMCAEWQPPPRVFPEEQLTSFMARAKLNWPA
jgi:hypothetical protein